MQSEIQFESNDKGDERKISNNFLIQEFHSNKNIVLVYAEEVEQAEVGNWEIGNIEIKQQVIKKYFNVFLEINTSDKILFTNGQIIFLADVIETFDDGFRIKKTMPLHVIGELGGELQTEIESAIRMGNVLSILYNKEEIYNLIDGLVLVDEELHINIHTDADFYLFNDLTDLLLGIKEILGFEKSFDTYIKIKLCSPGFIILTIASGLEFLANHALGIALLMCILFGGDIKIGENSVSTPSIAKGIRYLINAKKIKQMEALEKEYKEEEVRGLKLDNTQKENNIALQDREIKKLSENIATLKEIRDKMKIKKGKDTKKYIKQLDKVISNLENSL